MCTAAREEEKNIAARNISIKSAKEDVSIEKEKIIEEAAGKQEKK